MQLKVVSQGQNEYKTHLYSKYINKDTGTLCASPNNEIHQDVRSAFIMGEYQLFLTQIKYVTKEIKLFLASSHTYLYTKFKYSGSLNF